MSIDPNTGKRRKMQMISDDDLNARLEAAEERGRASCKDSTPAPAPATPASPPSGAQPSYEPTASANASTPTSTSTAPLTVTAIDALPLAGNHPDLIAELKRTGATRAEATSKILAAEQVKQIEARVIDVPELRAYVAKAESEGRQINSAQAAAEIRSAELTARTNPGLITAEQITSHMAQAKSQGRVLGITAALTELQALR